MRSIVYWLMGDRAGRTILATWHWLWGKPVESGGKIAVEVAQESLWAMQQSVVQLTQAVSQAMAAYEKAKQQYVQKTEEAKRAETQATQAAKQGQPDAARLAMARAIAIERVLPRFESQVQQAEQAIASLKSKLLQEQQKLESYQVQMHNLKALSEVSEALALINNVNSEFKVDSARSQFQEAQAAIEGRHIQIQAYEELSNPTEKLQANLDQMTIDSEIEARLQRINAS
jgi:phage shock protein A